MNDDLIFEKRGNIAHVTLNRPQARNALTFAMYDGLARIAGEVAADPGLRTLVIRGAGGKAFAAGTDISQFLDFKDGEDGIAYEERIGRSVGVLERCAKPVIAAIDGACTGGGAAIAAVCDLRVATRASRFGFPIARTLGNCLSIHNIARLAAIVGPTRVTDLIFTGRLIDAEEARQVGLVNEVVDDADALTARIDALAQQVAGMAPLTLAATKEQLRRLREATTTHVEDDDLVRLCFGSEDFRHGVRAFLERRPPAWQGR